ncbi:LOW QUALITY PROTEIN: adenosine receptor A1-like [Hippocampus comes]|uniref:LOW QUALITY PROTEIN: adenosine receptor A1-like n=1 Tax=Hippocampus comes TaxID=109280 RepID=UPI00094EDA00|nr:PREDICTED: LOW QUALITY PROTEIN: adenosine receptor A1-like [Hippocampus comes]
MPGALLSSRSLYIGMEVAIAVASVAGNVMVVWAVRINKSLRDTTFCFIVSLALADIAVGALVIPLAITISIGLQTHFYSCLLVACTVLVLTQSSILALLAIAIDRYLRVKIPTRYKRVVTPRRAGAAVVVCWAVAFVVGLTPMLGWNNLGRLRPRPMVLLYIAILLTHGNSAVNPIVYAFRIKKFRTAFHKIWRQYFCCKDTPALEMQPSDRKWQSVNPEPGRVLPPKPPQDDGRMADGPQPQNQSSEALQVKEQPPLLAQNAV